MNKKLFTKEKNSIGKNKTIKYKLFGLPIFKKTKSKSGKKLKLLGVSIYKKQTKMKQNNTKVTKYKIFGISLLKKIKSELKKKTKLFGITISKKKMNKQYSPKNNYSLSIFNYIRFHLANLIGHILFRTKYKKNKNAKILVCLHLYYMEAWPIIEKFIKNLSSYQYDLIVTFVSNHYKTETLDKIKKFKKDVMLYEYPNRGFDVGSFVDVLSQINLNKYDIVYKLQSKGTKRDFIFIYNHIFKKQDWFLNLYNGILGGCSVHKTIDYLLNNKGIGLVAAENLIINDPKHKQFFTHQIAQNKKIKIPQNYQYVAGTCFACKASALNAIKQKKITILDFEESKRGEFSFAHGMERIICAIIQEQGLKFIGIPTHHNHYNKKLKKLKKTDANRLLDDNRFTLDYEFFYKSLEGRKIFSYEISKLKIKNIKRKWIDGKIYSIDETSVYSYLQGNEKKYEEYCKINSQYSKFNMSRNRFDQLIASVKKSFNTKHMPVLNGENNIIADGQHRLAILLDKYGPDHEVTCLKLFFNPPQKKKNQIEQHKT